MRRDKEGYRFWQAGGGSDLNAWTKAMVLVELLLAGVGKNRAGPLRLDSSDEDLVQR